MSENQLEAFLAVVQYGSCGKAAEHLFVSQPTISYRMHALEKELGVKLFDHLKFHSVLTDAGRAFVPQAQKICNAMAEARRFIRDHAEGDAWPEALPAVKLSLTAQEVQLLRELSDRLLHS